MSRYKVFGLMLSFFIIGFTAMSQNNHTLKIAFSKIGADEKYQLYPKWISDIAPEVEPVDMTGMKPVDAAKLLEDCSGLVLTGGPDIYPGLYGKIKDLDRCEKVDRVRDSEEIMLIKKALEMKLPIFAICRGAQLMNVYNGGTLIVDIPTDYGSTVPHRLATPEGAKHAVNVEPRTYFAELLNVKTGIVNSFHHQAVDKLAPAFIPQAKSPDGLTEAYMWKEPSGKSFLIAVQWHPERMADDPLFSKKLAEQFIDAARAFKKTRN